MRPRLLSAAPAVALLLAGWLASAPAGADPTTAAKDATKDAPAGPVELDRVVVRWFSPETGGTSRPQFIFERELAFEARIEALSSPDPEPRAYNDRHVRAALDRHIAETLLSNLPILPAPTPKEIADRAESARGILEQRVGTRARLIAAAAAEGIGTDELDAILRRQARASLYLDRMVAPMLEPSEAELRAMLRTELTPFKDLPYEQASAGLRRWYLGQRMGQALEQYYQAARSRVTVVLISRR